MSIETITPQGAAALCGGEWRGGTPERWTRLQFDSRRLERGEMFIALKGRRDGHEYVGAAKEAGAAAALVERGVEVDLPQLLVDDALGALHRLAEHQRGGFEGEIALVTGSNGKSTTKEMLGSILRAWLGAGKAYTSVGNRNNHIGLPLNLLELRDEHECAVIEAGMSAPGEIAFLAGMAKPRFGVITNAGSAHLGRFKDSEGIARAKGELVPGVAEGGTIVLNADDRHFDLWASMAAGRSVRAFSHEGSPAAVCRRRPDREFVFEFSGCSEPIEVTLQVAGEHNERNALAAATAAWCMGATKPAIRAGLEDFGGVPSRQQFHMLPRMLLIDDSYNASPESFEAAVKTLADRGEERKVLVMGDMLELGPDSERIHLRTLRYARERGIGMVLGLGEQTGAAIAADDGDPGTAEHFLSKDDLIERIRSLPTESTALLVKGSRGMRMDEIVSALREG